MGEFKKCFMCSPATSFVKDTDEVIFYHVKKYHQYQSNFFSKCIFEEECTSLVFDKFSSFKAHWYKFHYRKKSYNDENKEESESAATSCSDVSDIEEHIGLATIPEVQCSMALSSADIETQFRRNFHIKTHQDENAFEKLLAEKTLTMRARFNIPYAGVQFLQDCLVELAVKASSFKDSIRNAVQLQTLSRYEIEKSWEFYYPTTKPKSITVHQLRSEGWDGDKLNVKTMELTGEYVPFKDQLSQLLNNQDIWNQVMKSFERNRQSLTNLSETDERIYKDVWDGDVVRNNPVYIKNRGEVLGIQIWHDDVELANSMGSRSGLRGKMTVLFWTLMNLPPHLRSSPKSINLLGIIESNLFKEHKPIRFLKPFIDELKAFESGIPLQIKHESRKWNVILLNIAGDIPAQNLLSGFKISVANAFKPSRICEITRSQLDTIHRDSDCFLRQKSSYQQQLEEIINEKDLKIKEALSKEYGIVEQSCFSQVSYVDVTVYFNHDLMHIAHEGVLNTECCLMLNVLFRDGVIPAIETINKEVKKIKSTSGAFDSLPDLRLQDVLKKKKLKFSASEMKTFCAVLPIVLDKHVSFMENEYYCNFLLLLEITASLQCYRFNNEDLRNLSDMIELHNMRFVRLYKTIRIGEDDEEEGNVKSVLTPKFHALIHLPQQIRNHGPLRFCWSFNYESMNVQLKKSMRRNCNHKNIAFSVASQFQLLRGLNLSEDYESDYFGEGHDFTRIKLNSIQSIHFNPQFDFYQTVKSSSYMREIVDSDNRLRIASSCKICGRHCSKGSVLLKKMPTEEALPLFWTVREIIVTQSNALFILETLNTLRFHYNSFSFHVESGREKTALDIVETPALEDFPVPLQSFFFGDVWHVIPNYYHLT